MREDILGHHHGTAGLCRGARKWTCSTITLVCLLVLLPTAHVGSRGTNRHGRIARVDFPRVIPAEGVWLGNHLALVRPAPAHLPRVVSRQRAIDASLVGVGSCQAALAIVSAPQRILAPDGPMLERLTWVVVETLPKPVDARIGWPRQPGEASGRHYFVRHRVSLVDARSGAFLLGFFTP